MNDKVGPVAALSPETVGVIKGLLAASLAKAEDDEKRRTLPDYLKRAIAAEIAGTKAMIAEFGKAFP